MGTEQGLEEEVEGMTLTAFLHGYPPDWSMGGEISTHRTLNTVPGATVFAQTATEGYTFDNVTVLPSSGSTMRDIIADAESVGSRISLS